MSFEAVDLTPRIGTEIRADRDTLLSGRHAAEIRDLLEKRGVLVFRALNFTDEQHKAFTRTLGELLVQGGEETVSISLDRDANAGRNTWPTI
jgi:alpha-ketoglutarate-dependent taurine dioxygenase